MRIRLGSPFWHLVFLCIFAVFMMGIWMIPVLFAGFPFILPFDVSDAKAFAMSGFLKDPVNPLVTLFLWSLHPLIAWSNVVGWSAVSAGTMAAALLPFWWMVRRLFGVTVAWMAVVLLSFMPLYWTEAVLSAAYPLAFFFLFLGFAFILSFFERHRVLTVILFGFCMGMVLNSAHAFLLFLPWIVVMYFLFLRRTWKRTFVELGLFGISLFITVVL
ncbi:MAG: hypothetical protein PHO54_04960, partial [Candidatus Peribacteraceae bacterium]|nr:hypothetical protein [Candidatus Peribacteraceae bacterium]